MIYCKATLARYSYRARSLLILTLSFAKLITIAAWLLRAIFSLLVKGQPSMDTASFLPPRVLAHLRHSAPLLFPTFLPIFCKSSFPMSLRPCTRLHVYGPNARREPI